MRGVRCLLAVVALLALASSCTSGTGTRVAVSPTPLKGTAIPGVEMAASLGWDGVDNRVMLVADVKDPHTQLTNIGVWTLTARGWEPMSAPVLTADDSGFESLNLAYDSGRHVELLISTTRDLPGTAVVSEWDGKLWTNVASQNAPTALLYGAYSPELRAWVGVREASPQENRTWLYDGTGWRPASVGILYTASGLASVAYDPTRHSVVALASYGLTTWQFDGAAWKEIPVTPPVPFSEGAIAFDGQHGQWIVAGGFGNSAASSQTWTGNGTSWTNLSPAKSPAARFDLASTHMAWDPRRSRAVMFGGIFQCCGLLYADTWEWDGRSWTKLFDNAPLADSAFLPKPEPCVASSSYGLVIAASKLEMVDTCGKVTAGAPLAPSSVQTCTAAGAPAVVEPPVSATKDKVYFRDGDTQIRSLAPDGTTEDVTKVPGGSTTVSMFSVSPDDQRIAVIVEDVSPTDSINLRLYVEDLKGAGNHSNIYATSFPKQDGTTLWPMGWHNGLLVLAVMKACSAKPVTLAPVEWHLVDPATGDRKVTVRDVGCTMGRWPSPAGDACAVFGSVRVYDWTAAYATSIQSSFSGVNQSGVSPSGQRAFIDIAQMIGCSGISPRDQPLVPGTCILLNGGNREVLADSRSACLWIDEDHLLAPDAVIGLPSPKFPYARRAAVYPLPAAGECAGRFPGGL